MATTNFTRLTTEQLTVWSRDLWKAARNASFVGNFLGSGPTAMIQRITELKKSTKGARAVITLIPDLEGDGVVGDNQLEGNEESIKAYDQVIRVDQLRNANRLEGRLADQKSVVSFREQARDVLAYWLSQALDQLAFLTLSGVSYTLKTNGATRVGSQWPLFEFAADVTAASTNRHRNWTVAGALVPGDTATITAADVPSWDMLLAAKQYAVDNYIRPIRSESGIDVYNVFLTPSGMRHLKKDDKFLQAMRHARERGESNPLFKGTPHGGVSGVYVDGLNVLEYRHVYNTFGAASGSKWGAGNAIDGQAVLLCGAQALGMADLGMPEWVEEDFDYGNSPGISIAKMFGLKKPVWRSAVTGTNEDFGVLRINTAY